MIHVPLVVELVLGVLQIVVHQQLAGFLNVRVAVRHGLAVCGRQEIFTKIWKFLWERTGRKELDSDEIWLLERMDRIAAIEEPDYDRMWERIRRKTICKNSPRVKLWRGVAAVALPMAVICTAVYFFREKTQQPSGQFLVENQKETSSRISLTLGNGKVLKIPKDSVGEVLKTGQVAMHQDSLKGIVYVVSGKEDEKLHYHTIEIPVGADYRLTLSDGTVVYLNSASKLTFPAAFVGDERRVFLEGEGYFEVESDKQHPFRVEVNGTIVEAVGTIFNINAYPEKDGVEATLVSGKVNVENGQDRVSLIPGQQARCGMKNIEVCEVDTREYISWKNGMFIFNEMTLENIMVQMQRWYGLDVFFQNESAKSHAFKGMIDKHLSPQEVFRIIEKIANVRFEMKGNTVVIE